MFFKIIQYRGGSIGASSLRRELIDRGHNCLRDNQQDILRRGNFLSNAYLNINWGSNTDLRPFRGYGIILNDNISEYTNKLKFLRKFSPNTDQSDFPKYWTDRGAVLNYMNALPPAVLRTTKIVVRKVLNGHSGNGIEIFDQDRWNTERLPDAPLYTLYYPKKYEYRVHFSRFSPDYIVTQKKKRREVIETPTTYLIRNVDNGWVYCREDIIVPEEVQRIVREFRTNALNTLDFGAIDIIFNSANNTAKILEVNTAPGLAGTTIADYGNFMVDAYEALMRPTSAMPPVPR